QIRAYVFEPGDTDRQLLVIAIDHLVFDHLSLSVLATEIQYLSAPSLRDRVPPVAISFAELATKIATLDTRSKEDELRQTITRMLGMGEVALQQPVRHVV